MQQERPIHISTLERYKLHFQFVADETEKKHLSISGVATPLSYHLIGYFLGQSVEFLRDDVLPEMQKAISGQSFDEDAGGILSFLTIGPVTSIFDETDITRPSFPIPTQDIFDIISAWVTWVTSNGLEKNAIGCFL